ncbi:hypothetical protein [Paenibacillus faecalis]|uniref:hypothetical protein n=1 Tax=Paenibacillus faecalis TaxID=2079532 RepID=UPI00131A5A4A|nr:hypothetical protein [Paenibacillus faecalis]
MPSKNSTYIDIGGGSRKTVRTISSASRNNDGAVYADGVAGGIVEAQPMTEKMRQIDE